MTPTHFLQLKNFSRDEFDYLFERTRWIKERFKRYEIYQPLRDRTLGMVFEKSSTRTRVSFEAAMTAVRRHAIFSAARHSLGPRRTRRGHRTRDCRAWSTW